MPNISVSITCGFKASIHHCSSIYSHINHSDKQILSKQRHIYPMFNQCWANVVDGGPTLVKHWVEYVVFGY